MSQTPAAISALVDNQATDLDLARLLRQLNNPATQAEALNKWQNYHLISSVLRGELASGQAQKFSQCDLSAKIAARLEVEPPAQTPANSNKSELKYQWLKTSGLAASVALVVIVTAQVFNLAPSGANKSMTEISAIQPIKTSDPLANLNSSSQLLGLASPGCSAKNFQGLTKPPYSTKASGLENNTPCQGSAITALTGTSPAQTVNYTPLNAP